MKKPVRTEKAREALLDTIKDAIDELGRIPTKKRRQEAARDLIYYIGLHHEIAV